MVPDVAADEELGAAVVEAIQSVSLSAPPPTDDERAAWEREILESVGVKDWATLERNAKLAHIDLDGRGWQLNRMRRWRGGGWMSISRDADQVVRLPRGATEAEIGHAVREILEPPNMHADTASIG